MSSLHNHHHHQPVHSHYHPPHRDTHHQYGDVINHHYMPNKSSSPNEPISSCQRRLPPLHDPSSGRTSDGDRDSCDGVYPPPPQYDNYVTDVRSDVISSVNATASVDPATGKRTHGRLTTTALTLCTVVLNTQLLYPDKY